MATFSATLHQRVATPVTPSHSPQNSYHSPPSASSTRSYTPIQSLSLHEYRKQQASPSTPDPPRGRRLKRKSAAAHLNASEREPLLPPTQPPPLPPTPPSIPRSDPPRHDPESPFARPLVASSRSLPALQQQPPSLGLRDIARLNVSAADLPPVGNSNTSTRPRDFGLGSRKRLPRPKDIEIHRPLISSPIHSDPSSLDLLSTGGLASTSTFTLSKFPFPEPPQSKLTTQPTPPLNVWPRESNPELTPSLIDTPPATPAVLHFRGTSFDVVNPHNSLYLSNLETPADLENESNDYFHRTSLDNLLPSAMDPSAGKGDGPSERPQRPLFNDLMSAHASIAKTRFQAPKAPEKHLPHDHAEAILSSAIAMPSDEEKPPRRTSMMERARTVFKRKESKHQDTTDEFKAIPYAHTSKISAVTETDDRNPSAFSMPDRGSVEETRPSGDTWETYSDSAIAHYDQGSEYANSEFDSNSMYFGPLNNRRSVPFGVQNQITDYSGEVTYQFDDTPRHSIYNHSARPSAASHTNPYTSKAMDNTIGNIYDQYGDIERAEGTVSTDDLITDDEDDDATIKVPSLRGILPSSPRIDRTSGLSQFDFGLDNVRNSGNPESPVSSPVTPQDGTSSKFPTLMRSPMGLPPRSLPPLAPGAAELPGQAYKYASDDFSNRASSYGDTRKLLGISTNIDPANRMSVITEGSRLSEGDKLPPSPLQQFIDQLESQRGTPEYEQFHQKPSEHSQSSLGSSKTEASMGSDDISVGGLAFPMSNQENVASGQLGLGLRKQAMVASAEHSNMGNDIPVMWMRSTSPGPASPRNDSPATMGTEGTDGDWETLGPTTTGGDHSRDGSHGQAHHEKLTVQNVTPPKRSNTNPWRKNKTDDSVQISPVMMSPTEIKTIPRFPRDSQLSFIRNGRHARDSRRSMASSAKSVDTHPWQLTPEQMRNLLANGPSEEIITEEHEMSPLAQKAKHRGLEGPSSPVLMESRVNSFDKFAVVGPKGNLTGTPMGTGMRHAGSSTVGSSSSPSSNIKAYKEIFAGSPRSVSTPARQSLLGRPEKATIYSPTAGGMVGPDQFTNFQTPTTHRQSPLAQGSIVSSKSSRFPAVNSYGKQIDSLRADASSRAERYRKMKAASQTSSSRTSTPRVNGLSMPRASVRGMTSPFPLELRHNDSLVFGSERSEYINTIRPGSTRTIAPLYRNSPHLVQRPRPDSSNMVDAMQKKKMLSWIIFAICAWFPPAAILMFFGTLDSLMFHMSGREIYHVGQLQKKCALVAFILEIVVVIVVLVLWLSHVF